MSKLSPFQDKEKQLWLREANAVATPQGWFNEKTREQLTADSTLIANGAKPVASWVSGGGGASEPQAEGVGGGKAGGKKAPKAKKPNEGEEGQQEEEAVSED